MLCSSRMYVTGENQTLLCFTLEKNITSDLRIKFKAASTETGKYNLYKIFKINFRYISKSKINTKEDCSHFLLASIQNKIFLE